MIDLKILNEVVVQLIVHDRILLTNEVMEHNNIGFDPNLSKLLSKVIPFAYY